MLSRLREMNARQGDLAIAAALSLILVLELALGSQKALTGPPVVNYGFGLVITGALAWRRRWPVWVVAAQLVAATASNLLSGDLTENPFATFLAVIVAMYSVGYYAPRPWSERGFAVGVAGIVLASAAHHGAESADDFIGPLILAVLAPWIAGRAAAVWAARARELAAVNERLQAEQEQRSLLAASEERGRIARELHDVVAHSISVMVVQSEGAKRMMDRDPARATQALEQIEATGRSALVEMRRLLGVLRKDDEQAALAPQPGAASLDLLIDRAHEAGLHVDMVIEGKERELPVGVDVTAYRIIQEALTNVLKHAGPTHADVVMRYLSNELEIEVVDAGPVNGFMPATTDPDNPQHGLLGMQERVKIYGGEVVTGPCDDRSAGYRVWARIPLAPA